LDLNAVVFRAPVAALNIYKIWHFWSLRGVSERRPTRHG